MNDRELRQEWKQIGMAVERLEKLSDDLMLLMESQSRAVVQSDAIRLESLAEEQMGLVSGFQREKEKMQEAMDELMIHEADSDTGKNWSALMEQFPSQQERLVKWRSRLTTTSARVKRQQEQVQELLAFARNHNERLLKTLFRRQDQEKESYSKSGEQMDAPSGMTINREV